MTATIAPPCPHTGGGYSYRDPVVYPQQQGLQPGEMRCHDCGAVVADPFEAARRHDAAQPCRFDGPQCRGEVSARMSASGLTTLYECGHHMDQAFQREQDILQRYPHHQPADFDPAYAGESWAGDDADY